MIALILTLVLIGVALYLIEQIPMDAAIRTIIRVVVLLAVLLAVVIYLLTAFGLVGLPVPRLR